MDVWQKEVAVSCVVQTAWHTVSVVLESWFNQVQPSWRIQYDSHVLTQSMLAQTACCRGLPYRSKHPS